MEGARSTFTLDGMGWEGCLLALTFIYPGSMHCMNNNIPVSGGRPSCSTEKTRTRVEIARKLSAPLAAIHVDYLSFVGASCIS